MNPITRFDDFAPDAQAVRESVIRSQFSTETGPDGAPYTGICKFAVPHWFDCLSERLGRQIVPAISCFRLNLAGELPHSWVHSDGCCASYATVLYLNEPEQCFGGTAFWKHKYLGITQLPTKEELGEFAMPFYARMAEDWKRLDLWEQTEVVPMQFNRLITYPTSLFHSRFPFEGFGSGPKDGRLIWICFYDLGEERSKCA